MCCKPGTPTALTSEQGDIGFQVRTLTDFSVEGNREQTRLRQRYVCAGVSKEA